jgi:hypothetical protein
MRWKLLCWWYKWETIIKSGKKIYELEMKNPVDVETILSASEDFVKFNNITQVGSIKDYLFIDYEKEIPRPNMKRF